MFIMGSRLPSQWLGAQTGPAAQVLQEGNPLDRSIDLILIMLAIIILILRSFKWGDFLRRNLALITFIVFALVSVVWSDFPLVSFKRWFRDLGNYLMILVVLSDPWTLEAVGTLLRRLFYTLIPLSILLDKYYPFLGKQYDSWTGAAMFVGATTSKNMLGVLCLVSALFFFWDTVTRWSDRKERRTKRIIAVNVLFFVMTLWLLNLANSATSKVCLAIGCMVIVAARSNMFRRHPTFLKAAIPALFCVYLILAFGFDINGVLASQVGRDPTLTGRTDIWKAVLSTNTNWLIGTGYESFWLGPRLYQVWRQTMMGLNESHNGYLEIYLNLGMVGILLLVVFLIAAYRTIWKRFEHSPSLASLGLATWMVVVFYDMTEAAAFRGQLLWVVFLLVVMIVPSRAPVPQGVSVTEGPAFRELPSRLREGVVE
jgi:exopolysaccharide production protein ExoQ